MSATVPPRGHFAHSIIRLEADGYRLGVGTAEFGNGTTTVHTQLAAEALGVAPPAVRIRQSDTALTEHDTGALGSTGTVLAGKATLAAAQELAALLRDFAAELSGDAGVVVNPRQCRGQIEGGTPQALRAALYEEVRIDDGGAVTTDILRQYHIPTFADVPRSEVYFAKTSGTWDRSERSP